MKRFENENVLIVEDQLDSRFTYSKLLEKNGYKTEVAGNGYEALEKLKSFSPSVILADWTMPEMDGLTLCEKLKNDPTYKNIYYIIITARITLKDKVEGLNVGADDFLSKPVDNEELIARIRSGVRIFNLQAEVKENERNRALIDLAFTTGHQINNPLASLQISLESIKNAIQIKNIPDLEDEIFIAEESLKRIKNAVQSLTNLKNPKLINYTSSTQMLDLDSD